MASPQNLPATTTMEKRWIAIFRAILQLPIQSAADRTLCVWTAGYALPKTPLT